jgi:hypothetical protein
MPDRRATVYWGSDTSCTDPVIWKMSLGFSAVYVFFFLCDGLQRTCLAQQYVQVSMGVA